MKKLITLCIMFISILSFSEIDISKIDIGKKVTITATTKDTSNKYIIAGGYLSKEKFQNFLKQLVADPDMTKYIYIEFKKNVRLGKDISHLFDVKGANKFFVKLHNLDGVENMEYAFYNVEKLEIDSVLSYGTPYNIKANNFAPNHFNGDEYAEMEFYDYAIYNKEFKKTSNRDNYIAYENTLYARDISNKLIKIKDDKTNQAEYDKLHKLYLEYADIEDSIELHKKLRQLQSLAKNLLISIRKNQLIYDDISVSNKFDEKFYFDIDFAGLTYSSSLGVNIVGNIRTGISLNVVDNIKLGTFIEYSHDSTHNIGIGFSVYNKNAVGFARYRLNILDKNIVHNFDIYGKYVKDFEVLDNFNIKLNTGLYTSIMGGKIATDKKNNSDLYNLSLKPSIVLKADISSRFNYKINTVNIYAEPLMKIGYTFLHIKQEIKYKEIYEKYNKFTFDYGIRLGVSNKFKNGVLLDGNLYVDSDIDNDVKMKVNMGVSYSW